MNELALSDRPPGRSRGTLEVLAPAHDMPTISAAAAGGAHAVYFGIDAFSMRRDMTGFTRVDLPRAVDACHRHHLKGYLTTNTVVYDEEIGNLHAVLREAKRAGIDAVIVQDLATAELARELGLEFHISTQCNVCNRVAADFWVRQGATRMILARELSLSQIRSIAQGVQAEIEVFVHGSMCFAYSGRCNFSQFFSSRLDNRGTCAQPCRRSWRLVDSQNTDIVVDEGHFFSAKDLCYIQHMPDLIGAGASVFKIEGRRKPPEYVEVTSRCYRQALDAYADGTFGARVDDWMRQLGSVANRGFSTGFLYGIPGMEDSTVRIPSDRATRKRTLVGEVLRYDADSGQMHVFLGQGELDAGEEIIVEGAETYSRLTVSTLHARGVQYYRASVGAEVVIPSDCHQQAGDRVYAWRETR